MSKKPHPTVSVGAKISPKLADELYMIAANEFEGNVSEAVRQGVILIIMVKSTSQLPPESAKRFYKLVDERFKGNIGVATREGIKLLLLDPLKSGTG